MSLTSKRHVEVSRAWSGIVAAGSLDFDAVDDSVRQLQQRGLNAQYEKMALTDLGDEVDGLGGECLVELRVESQGERTRRQVIVTRAVVGLDENVLRVVLGSYG